MRRFLFFLFLILPIICSAQVKPPSGGSGSGSKISKGSSSVEVLSDGTIVASGGNVGIGTSTPSRKLEVNGDAKVNTLYYTSLSPAVGGNVGTGTVNYLSKWLTSSTIGNSQVFDNGTNVGIGTSTPSAKVNFAFSASSDQLKITQSNTTAGPGPLIDIIDSRTGFGDWDKSTIRITAADVNDQALTIPRGKAKFFGETSFANRTVFAAGAVVQSYDDIWNYFGGGYNYRIGYNSTSGVLEIADFASTNKALYINSLNVGVGTSAPDNRLEVWGTDTTDNGNYILVGSVEGGYPGYGFGRIIGGVPTFTWGLNTYLNENDEYMYFYNAISNSNPFVLTEGGRLGLNRTNIVDYHSTFTGTGLNDAEFSGLFTGKKRVWYQVQISSTGTPDQFQWRKSSDGITYGSWSTASPCAVTPTLIEKGISVSFLATTGHTAADYWTKPGLPQLPIATLDVNPSYFNEVLTTSDYTAGSPVWTDRTSDAATLIGSSFAGLPTGTTSAVVIMRKTKFSSIFINIETAGAGITLDVQYWNGSAWTSLTSGSHDLVDGTANLTVSGSIDFDKSLLTGWASTDIDTYPATLGYYPIRLVSTTNVTTAPTFRAIAPNSDYRFAVTSGALDGDPTFIVDSQGRVTSTTLPTSSLGKLDIQSYRTSSSVIQQPQSVGVGNNIRIIPGGGTGLDRAVAMGINLDCASGNSAAGGSGNICLGSGLTIPSGNSNVLVIGSGIVLPSPTNNGVFIGRGLTPGASNNQTIIGTSSSGGANSTVVGTGINGAGSQATAIGRASICSGANCTALGSIATASGAQSTAVGYNSLATATNGIAIGYFANTGTGTNRVAIGRETTNTADNQMAIGNATYPLSLLVTSSGTFDVAKMIGNIDSYAQLNMQNINAGNSASSDIVATADNGSETTYYVDMGINSSTYNDPAYSMVAANDAYLIAKGGAGVGGNLAIATATSGKDIKFHTGDTVISTERMRITGGGNVGIGVTGPVEKLEVSGNLKITGAGGATEVTPSDGILNVAGSIEVQSADWHYWGDATTDGSWREGRDGNNLVHQRRESGTWVTKETITP